MPTSSSRLKYVIVGAGFSGAVLARELAENTTHKILVVDERSHIAGNCHTERDADTRVMVHQYGPHIFNTDYESVWSYVQRFGKFRPFTNRVKAKTSRGMYSMPLNLLTINQFFGKTFSPAEARTFVAGLGDQSIVEPQNFEEQALKFLGRDLYQAFFYGYTKKQWGCEPTELSASILKRLPVRFNYDDNYYSSIYQGIPEDGYSSVIERILDHPQIEVQLGRVFCAQEAEKLSHVFYTGPIDGFFGFSLGRLGYRTVTFEKIDTGTESDYQGNAVINYPEQHVPYTRIHEHKHFTPWETHARTLAFREHSKATEPADVPYYPIRRTRDMQLLARYQELAREHRNVSFLGRLGTYRYLDMDDVIFETLDFSKKFLSSNHGSNAISPEASLASALA